MTTEKNAQEKHAASEDASKRKEVTIKFGKGLVGESFISKSGKELVEIKIPNKDVRDHRHWESFVVSPKMVHENKYGKGVWMKLPADGTTKESRPAFKGQDENGKNIWETESRMVSNQELKSMMEFYKETDKESVRSELAEKRMSPGSKEKASSIRTGQARGNGR